MRYAVLSDIHGNLEALTAVLDALHAQRIDRYLCLGDSVGYGADPAACLARLQGLGAVMIAGNHEWACLGKLDVGWFNDAARAAITWTRDQLGFVELNALRRLPLTATAGKTSKLNADFATGLLEVKIQSQGRDTAGMAVIRKADKQVGTLGSGVAAHLSVGTYQVIARYRAQQKTFDNVAITAGQRTHLEVSFE